ncbi:hypothetical protein [Saguinine gammaherpesvirus 1]|uniref:Uncharacterized protein n=1 Tax=Saguinine gammaherpesvirus 1 TaxID=2169901 RepID=A0A9Q8QWD6_9GAMA|nr:hypothetical protein [Saguinine gammaherpesvirus 1]
MASLSAVHFLIYRWVTICLRRGPVTCRRDICSHITDVLRRYQQQFMSMASIITEPLNTTELDCLLREMSVGQRKWNTGRIVAMLAFLVFLLKRERQNGVSQEVLEKLIYDSTGVLARATYQHPALRQFWASEIKDDTGSGNNWWAVGLASIALACMVWRIINRNL